jgi:hypothetical protein
LYLGGKGNVYFVISIYPLPGGFARKLSALQIWLSFVTEKKEAGPCEPASFLINDKINI